MLRQAKIRTTLVATKLRDKLQQTAPLVVTFTLTLIIWLVAHAENRSRVVARARRHHTLFHYA